MSRGIKMTLVMNLLPLLFSAALVRSEQSTNSFRSFKIGENVTYDCIDISKQPVLDHPLLINHTIQMKPSVSRLEVRSQTGNNKAYKRKTGCPYGTVPILRNPKEFAQGFDNKYFHPLSSDSPGTHIAGVRSFSGPFHGIEAWMDWHNLNIGRDQASYSEIYIGNRSDNQVNFISAGWMINPGYFGDGRVWKYGFWQGKDGQGCYSMACSGFVQVSNIVPISEPMIDFTPGKNWMHLSINQDQISGNWWLSQIGQPSVDVGYWPKELFNLLSNGASMAGAGGVVHASPSGSSPPMGNGGFPIKGYSARARNHSALFTNIEVLSSNYEYRRMNKYHIDILLDSTKCYGLKIGKVGLFRRSSLGFFFNYGGPGGNFCGT